MAEGKLRRAVRPYFLYCSGYKLLLRCNAFFDAADISIGERLSGAAADGARMILLESVSAFAVAI